MFPLWVIFVVYYFDINTILIDGSKKKYFEKLYFWLKSFVGIGFNFEAKYDALDRINFN